MQTAKNMEVNRVNEPEKNSTTVLTASNTPTKEIFAAPRVVPMVLSDKDPIVLSFDEVPGPKALKYLSTVRYYLSEIGTQVTAGILTFGLNIRSYVSNRKSIRALSSLFDEYGPVVRFVSPVGGDIVLLNHPDHIRKVFAMEGDYPVRSTLESLEKYRLEHRNNLYSGLYTAQGQDWIRQRTLLDVPLHNASTHYANAIYEICDKFTTKIYNLRNHQDEIVKDFYKEIHKWAFDCMGLLVFSKKFSMIDTELVYSQCDMSWMYHNLEKATEAIDKCESGWHAWKLFTTPSWFNLVKYCDNLDNLIGKHVLEAERQLSENEETVTNRNCLINAILLSDNKLSAEDIATILMDMLLIGVNTIASSMSYLLYYIAKHRKVQMKLYEEIATKYPELKVDDITKLKQNTPYLQACIKETLRLVPPIPLLTRILPKNITLDRYNIPRGTLIIMSTQDAAVKESHYDDAKKFDPERWLKEDSSDYHAFASVPFGYGARKCLGQNIAETMISLLTIRVLQKYKLEYHYGDIQPTRSFISRPSKPLKIRFIDRI
ncbi:probable cytochrome P450 301a1, mitochondrial [Zerene cesonia]|uniref:probable cytochrome P450 301a1, mitochondrial n=1 Tax=Zerene cesonia TaxID=33412 RepID=UPI0018E5A34E|nr:probable cytochrome P450 301a1, mitochondrial [Zerene cesonia]